MTNLDHSPLTNSPRLILKDDPMSSDCYAVRLFLYYHQVPFQSDYADIDPLQPSDKIPELVVADDQIIYGIRPSLEFLAEFAAQPDWAEPSHAQHFQHWEAFHQQLKNCLGRLRQASLSMSTFLDDEDILQEQSTVLLNQLNDHLCVQTVLQQQWLVAGKTPSIADLTIFPLVALSMDAGIDLDDFVHIRRWVQRMRKLPNFVPMPGLLES
ncbi:glutathione S-transferase [Acinetobacter populi]|uniref:GST C-terminal domain-containing protein n=1 Tax=Acinetobacter populi TaxID=1582270 RepID=A0A1Z9Z3W6_9GAMM|nr:glutathione S-transferase [Acinetobacter populi]OUY09178.1 hypothetical protein CAP51_06180 [Acinetobacter populi]